MRKGQLVTYPCGSGYVSAKVLTAHRDGTLTVEAHFAHDRDGKIKLGGWLGYRYRINQKLVEVQT